MTFLTRGAIIAALYAAITILLAPISYGPLQVRVSEALTVLPYLEPAAVPGLFVGCIFANIYGGLGPWDIFGGSLLTLIAAFLTWQIGRIFRKSASPVIHYYFGPLLALLPPVIINAFGVACILMVVLKVPYWITALYVGIGQSIAVYILGYPLLLILLKGGFPTGLSRLEGRKIRKLKS
ncbi:MAG: QueT transporter family protein [Actinomycetota bacterium]|nr:QueT transporter family protein [Actinomycetota bacterium]